MSKKIMIVIAAIAVAVLVIIAVILSSVKKQESLVIPSANEPNIAEANSSEQFNVEQLREQRRVAIQGAIDRPYVEKIASLNEALKKAQLENNQQEVNRISSQIKILEQKKALLFNPDGSPRTRPDAQKRNLDERMQRVASDPNQPTISK